MQTEKMTETVVDEAEEARRYAKSIRRQIRAGILPRFFLVKGSDNRLERKDKQITRPVVFKGVNGFRTTQRTTTRPERRLTWRMVSTFDYLTKGSK